MIIRNNIGRITNNNGRKLSINKINIGRQGLL